MQTFRNLTPHKITICPNKDTVLTITSHDAENPLRINFPEARMRMSAEVLVEDTDQKLSTLVSVIETSEPSIAEIQRFNAELDKHIEPETANRAVIVPRMLLPYVEERFLENVYAPDTSPESVVRDADGRIVAVRRLVQRAG